MKNTIFLDTGVISLYLSGNKRIQDDIRSKLKKKFCFISSELNYIELFSHICKKKGKVNAQVIMENLRREDVIQFLSITEKVSILAGELKCKYSMLSIVDSVIIAEALTRNLMVYTTETGFDEIENLKVEKIDF
jgi:predicted nucleic acid-binding protein